VLVLLDEMLDFIGVENLRRGSQHLADGAVRVRRGNDFIGFLFRHFLSSYPRQRGGEMATGALHAPLTRSSLYPLIRQRPAPRDSGSEGPRAQRRQPAWRRAF
jgi:hypothetical protein